MPVQTAGDGGAVFSSRRAAGATLAGRLANDRRRFQCVIAIANGGAPVAERVASRMRCAMTLCHVSRLIAPGTDDLSVGALYAESASPILDEDAIRALGCSRPAMARARRKALARFRDETASGPALALPSTVAGQVVLIVDDGIATGCSMAAAVSLVSGWRPRAIVAATPVTSGYGFRTVLPLVDDVVYLHYADAPAFHVASFYREFPGVSAEHARALATPRADR